MFWPTSSISKIHRTKAYHECGRCYVAAKRPQIASGGTYWSQHHGERNGRTRWAGFEWWVELRPSYHHGVSNSASRPPTTSSHRPPHPVPTSTRPASPPCPMVRTLSWAGSDASGVLGRLSTLLSVTIVCSNAILPSSRRRRHTIII